MKRIVLSVIIGIAIGISVIPALFFITHEAPPEKEAETSFCPFCTPKIIDYQGIYTGKYVRILYNYQPLMTGHCMIIPKRHVERCENLTDEEAAELHEAARKLNIAFKKVYNAPDYVLMCQNGRAGGQTVNHTHIHMLPREESSLITKCYLWKVFMTECIGLRKPVSPDEMEKQTAALRAALPDAS